MATWLPSRSCWEPGTADSRTQRNRWDEKNRVVLYFSLTNNGWHTAGTARLEGEKLLTEGKQTGPTVERETRSACEFLPDGSLRDGLAGG
jgi:hypothetical protein